jgi:hypothetical protein
MRRALLPRLVFALLAAFGLASQSALPVAHAVVHRAESDVGHRAHDGDLPLVHGDISLPTTEAEDVHDDLDHSSLHAVVTFGPTVTLTAFVPSSSVTVAGPRVTIVVAPPLPLEVLARPPGLSAPPAASRAPPIA